MKKLFFGTVLDNEDRSHKAIMEKDFVERKELYRLPDCQALTHDEKYIYTANSDHTVDKIRKSNFEIVGTYYGDYTFSGDKMREGIESDNEYIYILERSLNASSERLDKVVKIDKETMIKVAESDFYRGVNSYTTDNVGVYFIMSDTRYLGSRILSKENLTTLNSLNAVSGQSIAVDSNYVYAYRNNYTHIDVFDKNTFTVIARINTTATSSRTELIVHAGRLYFLVNSNVFCYHTTPPFSQLATGSFNGKHYFGVDAIYSMSSKDIRKYNLSTLLMEWVKPWLLGENVDFLLKEEEKDLFYFFRYSDKSTLRTLKEGYKLIGFERVE